MGKTYRKNPAAVELGRKGGQKKSDKKTTANRANIKKRWDNYKKHGKKESSQEASI